MSRKPALLLLLLITAAVCRAAAPESAWVHPDPATGRLVYKTTPRGDRILDFSSAGYGGGGVPLPDFATIIDRATLIPSGRDDTQAIQNAIDTVSAFAPNAHGIRGAVRLAPGIYNCASTITIAASGVVLRGSGFTKTTGKGETLIRMVGGPPHLCFRIGGPTPQSPRPTIAIRITDDYVPSSATTLHLGDTTPFHPGDRITIHRPITPTWVASMGMNQLVRNGKKETWIAGETTAIRTVTGVSPATHELTLDIPLSDPIDAAFLPAPSTATVTPAPPDTAITHVGIENLHILSPPQPIVITDPQNRAVEIDNVRDGYLRDLACDDTINSVQIGRNAHCITVANVTIRHTVATLGAAKPLDFETTGTQILFDRCTDIGDNLFYFATGSRASGPTVLLHCAFHGGGWLQPHQRWSTGLLIDSCSVPEGGIDLMDRGIMGSGHGWTIGWSVAWNCTAKTFLIQQPPGAMNWAVGCRGRRTTAAEPGRKSPTLPDGTYDSPDQPVAPDSLYLAQLRERLGKQDADRAATYLNRL
jgi:hypothetical protein